MQKDERVKILGMCTFDAIVEALGGDYLMAYRICNYFAGLNVRFPSKTHRVRFAELMCASGYSKEQVISATGISRATYYNIIHRERNIKSINKTTVANNNVGEL